MKFSLKVLFAMMLAIGLLFTACNKDDDDDDTSTPSNYLKYDGQTIELTKGFIENYGENDPGVYNLDLTLLSSGIKIHYVDGEIDSMSGTGSGLYFELFTSKSNELDNRTYSYDTVNMGADGTFDYGDLLVNFNLSTFSGVWTSLVAGTLVVNKVGNTYEFTLNATDDMGKSVKAHYKGSVDYFDYDTKSGMIEKRKNLLK